MKLSRQLGAYQCEQMPIPRKIFLWFSNEKPNGRYEFRRAIGSTRHQAVVSTRWRAFGYRRPCGSRPLYYPSMRRADAWE
jgi:hypothetical protein